MQRARTLLALTLLLALAARAEEPLRVAVAANFRATLEAINDRYLAAGGTAVRLSSASTGVLANQALYGAPFHLLLAADTAAPALLARRGVAGTPFCFAVGQLALAGGELSDLGDPTLSIAIGNPNTAPYGRAALQVLDRPAFGSGAGRRLVRGNNVLQAYQFWRSGAVDLALVARSLTGASGTPIPPDWHQPLQQHAVILREHPELPAYLAHLRSDSVRSLILDAGYLTCP